jgi:iron(III) transport system substrate-binding protein
MYYRSRNTLLFLMLSTVLAIIAVACQPQTVEVTRVVTETVVEEVTRVVSETETVTEMVEVEVTRVVQVEVPAAEAGPGRLVIYSGRSETLVDPIIQQFAAATGIQVDVRYGGTAELAATILEEGQNSPADIFYAQDPGGLGAVAAAGLLSPLPDRILERVPARYTAATGEWIGISGRARVITYNTDAITDPENQLPDDLWGFTEPEWNGRIGWAPTNGSFQAMLTAMRTIWGEEQTAEWLLGIQANNPTVYQNNTTTVTGVAAGEVDVGFVNHYYLYRFLDEQGEGFKARNYFLPSGGPGSLVMVSGAGILHTAPNRDNAERFLEFLLSVPGQQYFASRTFEYPLVEGVATSSELLPLAELDAVAVEIDLSDMADLEGTVQLLSDLGILP